MTSGGDLATTALAMAAVGVTAAMSGEGTTGGEVMTGGQTEEGADTIETMTGTMTEGTAALTGTGRMTTVGPNCSCSSTWQRLHAALAYSIIRAQRQLQVPPWPSSTAAALAFPWGLLHHASDLGQLCCKHATDCPELRLRAHCRQRRNVGAALSTCLPTGGGRSSRQEREPSRSPKRRSYSRSYSRSPRSGLWAECAQGQGGRCYRTA